MTDTPFPEFDLTGKVAVVTGAAGGLGGAIATGLARYGADMVLCSTSPPKLDQVKAEVEGFGRRALVQKMNVAVVSQINDMVAAAMAEFGRIDILVTSAGLNIPQWAEDVTEEAWDTVMSINLRGLFFCCQAVGKVMIGQKSGKIINVSSQSGSVGLIKRAAYCSSKGAVDQLTRTLAIEWAKHNINVNAIAPTFIQTPLTKPMFEDPEFRKYCLDNIPLGRIGDTDDVVGGAVYLASRASDLVTGHILMIDGGWTAQ